VFLLLRCLSFDKNIEEQKYSQEWTYDAKEYTEFDNIMLRDYNHPHMNLFDY